MRRARALATKSAIRVVIAGSSGMTWPPACSMITGSAKRSASDRESRIGMIPSARPMTCSDGTRSLRVNGGAPSDEILRATIIDYRVTGVKASAGGSLREPASEA